MVSTITSTSPSRAGQGIIGELLQRSGVRVYRVEYAYPSGNSYFEESLDPRRIHDRARGLARRGLRPVVKHEILSWQDLARRVNQAAPARTTLRSVTVSVVSDREGGLS